MSNCLIVVWWEWEVLGLSFVQSFDIVDGKTNCHPMASTLSSVSVAKNSQLQNCRKCLHDIIILVMMLFGLLHDIFVRYV